MTQRLRALLLKSLEACSVLTIQVGPSTAITGVSEWYNSQPSHIRFYPLCVGPSSAPRIDSQVKEALCKQSISIDLEDPEGTGG